MRILTANKFWYRRGGLERVMFDEIRWLEEAGHEVAHFSTMHPQNVQSEWSEYFAPYLELGESGGLGLSDRLRAAARMFSNPEAGRRFANLLDEWRPDVVHVHGIHRQLSPSILEEARRRRIPVVQTIHDYHHVCPNDVLLLPDGSVCEPRACGRLNYANAVRRKCVRGSLGASLVSATETAYQRLRHVYERTVQRFICPSAFMSQTMERAGWTLPMDVVANAVPTEVPRSGAGEGFVYIGRLAREKGIHVAARAARDAGTALTIAGDGPLREELERRHPEASFLGHLDAHAVGTLIRGARAVVVPSLWYENAPMSVLEPMASAVPVIASAVGGIPEQVTDGAEGLLVNPGDIRMLADAMRVLDSDPNRAQALGEAGRVRVEADFSPRRHVEGLLESYERAIER